MPDERMGTAYDLSEIQFWLRGSQSVQVMAGEVYTAGFLSSTIYVSRVTG